MQSSIMLQQIVHTYVFTTQIEMINVIYSNLHTDKQPVLVAARSKA
jgi:hypothetical protein